MHRHQNDYRETVSDQEVPRKFGEFHVVLKSWFESGRNYQFLVSTKTDNTVIGSFFFYGLDLENKVASCSCFFIPKYRKTLATGEALMALGNFAIKVLDLKEITFSVYSENDHMLRLALRIGARELGTSQSQVNQNRTLVKFSIGRKNSIKYFESC